MTIPPRILSLALAFLPLWVATAHAQTELGSEDDLTVLGTDGTALDPDTEIKGFTVFGSTQAAYTGAVIGAGNVVVNGVLAVSSGAYFVGNSTFSSAGKIFINDGSTGQLLLKNSAGHLEWGDASATGDNLGDHIATTTLQMGSYSVNTSSDVTAARYQINGSTVLALLPGTGSLGVGFGAGRINIGAGNSFVGYYAGYANVDGEKNSFLGSSAGQSNSAGSGNAFVGYESGRANTAGNSNTFMGYQSGYTNTTGAANSFIGYQAGYSNVSGSNNSYVGYYAGKNSTASNNSFLGYYAGYNTNTGSNNAFFGFNSGFGNTKGSNNSFFGYQSGVYGTTGINNSFVGYEAGRNIGSGSGNSILGYQAGYGSSGNVFSSSTLVGYQAGYSLLNGAADNIFLGWKAGYNVTTGTGNIVIGHDKTTPAVGTNNHLNIGGAVFGDLSAKTIGIGRTAQSAALDVVSTGAAHTEMAQIWRAGDGVIKASMSATGVLMADKFIGDGSGLANLPASPGDDLGNHIATTTLQMGAYGVNTSSDITAARYQINGSTVLAVLPGTRSFGAGPSAGKVNRGAYNTFVGSYAGEANTTGTYNSYIGSNAGFQHLTGYQNTFVGSAAGESSTAGGYNTLLGALAGAYVTGSYNTFIGVEAGGYAETNNNTFVGYNSGYTTDYGGDNTFIGSNTGSNNSGGINNSFFGSSSGNGNTKGGDNVSTGYKSGYYTRTGSANAIYGSQAGYGVSGQSFSSSTVMGYKAGYGLSTGSDNLLLGFQSGNSLTTGSRNIIIGFDEDAPTAATNDYINIGGLLRGDMAQSTMTVYGDLYADKFYGDGSTLAGVSTDTLKIGESYGGGIVFWVDSKSKRALISAAADLPATPAWGTNTSFTGASLDGVYAGRANTVMISTMQASGTYAARLCQDYSATVNGVYYDDWYLPSLAELQLLYPQKTVVGGFQDSWYWSSNEYVSNTANAGIVHFNSGSVGNDVKTNSHYFRCVRAGPFTAFDYSRDAETVRNGAYITSTQTFSGGNSFTGETRIARQITQAADTGITLASPDFGKTITINSASAQTVNLPAITAADIGATITVVKFGAGTVTIDAPAGVYIADSGDGGTIYNNVAAETYATITLRLATSTTWSILGGNGSWTTTN